MTGTWAVGRRGPLIPGGTLVALSLLVGLGMGVTPADAAFPGLNGRIACDGARGPAAPTPPPANFSQSEVYSMNPDGSDLKLLTNNEGVRDLDPSFSPNGARIAFDSRPVGGSPSDVYTMNADGSALKRITAAPANDERTAWSPDGNSITFMGGRTPGNFDIFRVAADGSDPLGTRLTTHPAGDFSPAWSPDGTTIAFDTGRDSDQNSEIYTMNAVQGDGNTAQVKKLTNTDPPVRNWSASWSPDGTKIVFQSTRDGTNGTPTQADDNFEIYTMNPNGSGVTRLTNAVDDPLTPTFNEAADADPAFSPDGRKIVFESNRAGDTEVHTMNADGSGVTRLTNSPGFDGRCDWQPIRPAIAPIYPPIYPPITPPGGKLKTSLTLKAKPRRDRRPPFKFTFSGRVRIPGGVSAAAVCGGRVRLVLRKGRRTVARGTAGVSKGCTYRKRIAISPKRTGRKRARLRVTARFGGNASLSSASRRSTTVRIF